MHFDVKNLSFLYKDNMVLRDVSFSLDDGELVALLGRNGSGKTTLFRLLLGFLPPASGSIKIDGVDISEISTRERAKLIAYIPQHSETTFPMTVLDTVVMGRSPSLGILSRPSEKDVETARYYIKLLGLEKLENRSITKLSGGERKLALLARALTQDARILLLDEPTSELDYSNQLLVLETALRLKNEGYSILFSTHNPQQGLMPGASVLLLDEGKSEYYRDTSLLSDGERLSKLYKRKLVVEEVDTSDGRRLICIPL